VNLNLVLKTLAAFSALALLPLPPPQSRPLRPPTPETIASKTATLTASNSTTSPPANGPAVILLHGYTQTSRMWRPIIPLLAEKFTVIAPDLPGIGDSGFPRTVWT